MIQIGYSRPGHSISVNGVRRDLVRTNVSIPAGGTGGAVLVKRSAENYDMMWMDYDTLPKVLRNDNGDFLLNDETGEILLNG